MQLSKTQETNTKFLETRCGLKIQQVLSFGDFLVVTYESKLFLDILKKSGNLLEMHDIIQASASRRIELKEILHVKLPKLEWSDRYVDMIQQSKKVLSKKIIIVGSCINLPAQRSEPFLMLYDR